MKEEVFKKVFEDVFNEQKNAEDTVMGDVDIEGVHYDSSLCDKCPTPDGDCEDCIEKRIAIKQSEISFKAGIKEVVEWISEHVTNQSINPTIFPRTAWQQKCKEWGI